MQHVGRVNVFQTAECLIDEGLEMCVREGLTRTNLNGKKSVRRLTVISGKFGSG
jgi:hypothetical protein